MRGVAKRLAVVLGVLPAIFLEWASWVATGHSGDYATRLMRWGCEQ